MTASGFSRTTRCPQTNITKTHIFYKTQVCLGKMAWARESEGVETACLWERSAGSPGSHLRVSHALRHLFSKTHQLPRSPLQCWALPQLCGTRPLIFLADYSLLPNNYPRGEWSSRSSQRERVLEMRHLVPCSTCVQVYRPCWHLSKKFPRLPDGCAHSLRRCHSVWATHRAGGRERDSLPAAVPLRRVQLGLKARQHPLHEAA